MIDDYLRALDRSLIGPARLKSDLLAEARHGLVDAAEAYQQEGLDPRTAQTRAVAEFGAPADLAPAYQAELAVTAARRLAARIAVVSAVTGLVSTLMWRGAPWTGGPPPGWYSTLSEALDRLGYAVAAFAVLAVFGLGWAARRSGGTPRRTVRAVAIGGYAVPAALGLGGGVMWVLSVRLWDAAASWPPMLVGGVALIAVCAWLGRSAGQCRAAARSLPRAERA
jgi:hypothetical protein